MKFAIAGMLIGLIVCSCHDSGTPLPAGGQRTDTVLLVFQIELNRQTYEDSAWGDPPQLAIWLENEEDRRVRTVAVTHRMGAGDWEGKVECAVALPYWVTFYNRETNTNGPPTWDHPATDTITCATPRATLNVSIEVPRGTPWTCFVEANVSGDYSSQFPSLSAAGISDRYGNGQPSIVYRSSIEAIPAATSRPELWGRTDQYTPVDTVNTDLEPITTARRLLRILTVSCVRSTGQGR